MSNRALARSAAILCATMLAMGDGMPVFGYYVYDGCYTCPTDFSSDLPTTCTDIDVTCRIKDFDLDAFRDGDVVFVGDSLTDEARLGFEPLFPRTHNLGIRSSKIADAEYILFCLDNALSGTLDNALSGTSMAPSVIVVQTGGNDIIQGGGALSTSVKQDYDSLFDFLSTLKTKYSCRVIIRGYPPVSTNEQILVEGRALNFYLKDKSDSKSFEFVNHHQAFWDSDENDQYEPYRRGDDHFNCSGYRTLLPLLAAEIFPKVQAISSGSVHSLPGGPYYEPHPIYPNVEIDGQIKYKYCAVEVEPFHEITVSVSDVTESHAVGIFVPDAPHTSSLPMENSIKSAGFLAQASLRNTTSQPVSIILIMGSSLAGTYNIESSPLNTTQATAALLELGQVIEGSITQNSPNGVYYKVQIPAGVSKIGAYFHDDVNANVTLDLGGIAGSKTGGRDWIAEKNTGIGTVYIHISSDSTNEISQRLRIAEVPATASDALLHNDGQYYFYSDEMPAIASDGGDNVLAVWYRNYSNSISVMWSKSADSGLTWSAPDSIYTWPYQIRSGVNEFKPTVVYSGSGWAIVCPGLADILLAEANINPSNWQVSVVPKVSSSTNGYDDYSPHIAALLNRPYDPDNLLISWMTRGSNVGAPTSIMDLAGAVKIPFGSYLPSSDPSRDYNVSSYLDRSHVTTPMTAVCTEPVMPVNNQIAFTWAETVAKETDLGLSTGPFAFNLSFANAAMVSHDILYNNYEIKSPQMVWCPNSRTASSTGYWILAWSMKNVPEYGNDFDIFYTRLDPDPISTSNPVIYPLNSDAAVDTEDDILTGLAATPVTSMKAMRAIWQKNRLDASDVYTADYQPVLGAWRSPQLMNEVSGGEHAANPAITASGSHWISVFQSDRGAGNDIYFSRK